MVSYYTEGADPNRIRTVFVREDEDYYYNWSSTGELKGRTAKSPLQKYEEFLKNKFGTGVVYEDYRGGKLRLTPASVYEREIGIGAFNPYHHSYGQLFPNGKTMIQGQWFYSLKEVVNFYNEKNLPRPRYEDRPIIPANQIAKKESEILDNIKIAKENDVPLPYTISHLEFLIDEYYMSVRSDSERTLTGDGIAEAQQLLFNLKGVRDAKLRLIPITTSRPTANPKKETVFVAPPEIVESSISYSPLMIAGVIVVVVILLLKRRRA